MIELKDDMIPDQEALDKVAEFISQSSTLQKNTSQKKNSQSSTNESNPDSEVKDFFKSENIDIDDDDFFEFFLKDGLKLPQEKIDELQQLQFDPTASDDDSLENDKFMDVFGDVMDNNDLDEGFMNALNESMKWLGVEGMEGIPFDPLKKYMADKKK